MTYFIILMSLIILGLPQLHAAQVAHVAVQSNSQEALTKRLFDAIEHGNLNEVKAAFLDGARIDAKNDDGLTPIIIAARYGSEDVLRYLIEDKKAKTDNAIFEITPLGMAAVFGHLNIVKYLVEKRKVDINFINRHGRTAFYGAARKGQLNIVKFFVERNGFDKNIAGVVAMSLAHQNNHQSIVDYLHEQGIPFLPKAGEASGLKSIFYNDKANSQVNFSPLEIIAYNSMSILASPEIISMQQGGIMQIYQPKVVKQGGADEPCVEEQLEAAVKQLGGTKEMHRSANPILGGTCAYHAVKNGLLGLVMLYDYDELVRCSQCNAQNCEKNAAWVSGDIENLVTLKTKSFDCERFMEQLHAKIYMLKSRPMTGKLEPINIQQGAGAIRMHVARHDIERELASIMANRYQVTAGKYYNSFTFVDEKSIDKIHSDFCSERLEINCEALYQSAQLPNIIDQIQTTDLANQIVLFRTQLQYRHAFILSINEGTLSGRGQSFGDDNRMHAITVVIDKRESNVNVMIYESNNLSTYAIKQIVFDFLDLLVDAKKCALSEAQLKQLQDCMVNTTGHWLEAKQEGLPSFKSLIDAYESALKEYSVTQRRDDIERAFFLLARIEQVYKRAEARAAKGEDEKIFKIVQAMLPERLLKHGLRAEEIALHKMIQALEVKELNDNLFTFVATNDLPKVKEALAIGAQFEARDAHVGDTPFLRAARLGHLAIIEYLLSQGADIEAVGKNGDTPLMQAADRGHFQIVEYLIKQGADVHKKDKDGNTALMYAAASLFGKDKQLRIVTLLVELGKADPTIINNSGQTALMLSAYVGAVDVVKYFVDTLKMPMNLDSLVNFMMQDQKLPGNGNMMVSLSPATIDYLIKEHGLTVQKNQALATKVLMAAAKKHNSIAVIKRLLEPDCGMEVNARDENGRTALMYAMQSGDQSLVKFLLEKGADINAKDNEGKTALMYAMVSGYAGLLEKLLLGSGADVNAKDTVGNTVLMYAAQAGDPYIVQRLVEEHHVNPRQTNAAGKTALDIARDNNRPESKHSMMHRRFFLNEDEQHFMHNDVIQFLEKAAAAHQ